MGEWYHAITPGKDQPLLEHYLLCGGSYQFCWHNPLELMLVLRNTAEVFADGRRYLLEENDLLLINSNCGHSTFLRDLDSLVLICEVSPAFFRERLSAELSTLQIDCASSPENRENPLFTRLRFFLAQSFANALQEEPAAQNLSLQYMSLLLSELMLHFPIQVTTQKPGKGKEREALQQAMDYIEANFEQKLTLEQVAAHVQYNRTYLSTLFKKSTGVLFNDYITRVRLRHALETLGEQDRSIVDIALDHGFTDSKAFSASMKKYCGRTPQEYRQALRQNPGLRAMQGSDKYLPRPQPEAERLLAGFSPDFGKTKAKSSPEVSQAILECRQQLEAVLMKIDKIL